MRTINLDIETSGLNPSRHQILEIAAVIDDTKNPLPVDKLPVFHTYIANDWDITGDPYALSMHQTILRRIAKKEEPYQYMKSSEVAESFWAWLINNGFDKNEKINFAGKNFGAFDRNFLQSCIPNFFEYVKENYRSIDPAMLFWHPDDVGLPDTKTCMERAGIGGQVAHTALEDALVVVKLVRKGLCGRI